MTCLTCPNSDGWHRRQIENLEYTIGPVAAQEFEQEHPEDERRSGNERRTVPRWIEYTRADDRRGKALDHS